MPLTVLAHLNSSSSLAFLMAPMHAQAVFLCSSFQSPSSLPSREPVLVTLELSGEFLKLFTSYANISSLGLWSVQY